MSVLINILAFETRNHNWYETTPTDNRVQFRSFTDEQLQQLINCTAMKFGMLPVLRQITLLISKLKINSKVDAVTKWGVTGRFPIVVGG